MAPSLHLEHIGKIAGFLNNIGIPVSFGPLPGPAFLPGIYVCRGGLIVDREQVLYPGDILHEAGHLAIMSPDRRKTADGNVGDDGGEEMAALAWSYAAACAIKIPPEAVFHDNGYKGDGPWLREHFQTDGTIGLPLLMCFDMTTQHQSSQNGTARPADIEIFPDMTRWLRQRPDLASEYTDNRSEDRTSS